MKKVVLMALAAILMLSAGQTMPAQNPVKKVKYLQHAYEGQVGKKKVPEGEGVMQFDGFRVQGVFQGEKVTQAVVLSDTYDVLFTGDLRYDESQSVVLYPGTKKIVYVYMMEKDLKGFPVTLEEISEERTINAGAFQVNEAPFSVNLTLDLPKELDPPTVIKKTRIARTKETIQYVNEEITEDGCRVIKSGRWFKGTESPVLVDGVVVSNPKRKTILMYTKDRLSRLNTYYVAPGTGNKYYDTDEGIFNYVDTKGRAWYCSGNSWLVCYPNGDYLEHLRDNRCYFKITLPDNMLAEYKDATFQPSIQYTVYEPSKNLSAIVSYKMKSSQSITESTIYGFFADPPHIDKLPVVQGSESNTGGPKIKLYNCEAFSDAEIKDFLETRVFPKIPIAKNEEGKLSPWEIIWGSNEGFIPIEIEGKKYKGYEFSKGYYYVEREEYLSDQTLDAQKSLEKQKDVEKKLEHNKKVYAKLDRFKQRFGFDPTPKSMRELVKAGASFKLLKEYFDFKYKLYYAYVKPISWQYSYPNEDREDYVVYDENGNPKEFMEVGYYFVLDIEREHSKCYKFGDTNNGTRGFVWVEGDKITTVSWY